MYTPGKGEVVYICTYTFMILAKTACTMYIYILTYICRVFMTLGHNFISFITNRSVPFVCYESLYYNTLSLKPDITCGVARYFVFGFSII